MNLYRLTYLLTFLLHTTFISFSCQGSQLLHQWNRSTLLNKKQLLNQIGKGIRLTRATFSTHLVEQPTKTYRDDYWLNRCTMTWPFFGKKNPEKINNAFLRAAEKGNLRKLTKAMLKGANVYTTDQKDNNALHYASMYASNDKAIHWLIDIAYLYIEAQNKYQRTPFLCAAEKSNLPALELLKKKGAHIYAVDENGNNALHLAIIFFSKDQVIEWLINTAKIAIEAQGQYQRTPFLFAAKKGNFTALKLLWQKGAQVDATDQYGNNALHLAAFSSEVQGVRWLIDTAKIAIEAQGQYQRTPFLFAAEKGNVTALKLLWQKGAQVHAIDEDGNNALHLAALYSPEGKGIGCLLDTCNLPIDTKNKYGRTPFFYAAEEGNLTALKLLWQKGAQVDAIDEDGNNALHFAALYSPEGKGIGWLLDTCNLPVDAKNKYGATPFFGAAETGNLPALKMLKAKGANLNVTDQNGNNALHYAARYAPAGKGIAWLIHTAHLSTEIKNNNSKTAFLCAAEKGNLSALKILKEKGANINAKDQNGKNALALAKKKSVNQATIDWLEKELNVKKKKKRFIFF